jgi:hypothetical protein
MYPDLPAEADYNAGRKDTLAHQIVEPIEGDTGAF